MPFFIFVRFHVQESREAEAAARVNPGQRLPRIVISPDFAALNPGYDYFPIFGK
jgi:hypothetical protein